jgi:hypothetical protein
MNRYQGNSGLVERLPELGEESRRPRTAVPVHSTRPPLTRHGGRTGGLGFLGGLEDKLGGVLSKVTNLDLETEDIILLLILYLMYRESRDEQLLLVMGILLFL